MIKGKAKVEFGNGTVQTWGVCVDDGVNNIGALCLYSTYQPHDIGSTEPILPDTTPDNADVILTFSKPESIDVLIRELTDLKSLMLGRYEGPIDEYDKPFDFDRFLQ